MSSKKDDPFFESEQVKTKRSLAKTTHGFTKHGKLHPLYQCWHGIKRRCLNPKRKDYPYYGGRGIKICERWMSFGNFRDDMYESWKPGLTIERRDNDKDYCPENCYWATREQQALNTRQVHLVTIDGVTKCMAEWQRFSGLKRYTFYGRIIRGWTVEDAVKKPLKKWTRQ